MIGGDWIEINVRGAFSCDKSVTDPLPDSNSTPRPDGQFYACDWRNCFPGENENYVSRNVMSMDLGSRSSFWR
jgi:hypothetical protein